MTVNKKTIVGKLNREQQQQQYQQLVNQVKPKPDLKKNLLGAFLIGGTICLIGQFFLMLFRSTGLAQTDAGAATAAVMIFLGALLTGLGVYDNIAKVAGAGSIVPITGFANSIVSPALEFKREGYDTHAGGSGCACSAVVTAGYLLQEMQAGRLKRILGIGTGALLSPTSIQQGESIPGIGHAVTIEI